MWWEMTVVCNSWSLALQEQGNSLFLFLCRDPECSLCSPALAFTHGQCRRQTGPQTTSTEGKGMWTREERGPRFNGRIWGSPPPMVGGASILIWIADSRELQRRSFVDLRPHILNQIQMQEWKLNMKRGNYMIALFFLACEFANERLKPNSPGVVTSLALVLSLFFETLRNLFLPT